MIKRKFLTESKCFDRKIMNSKVLQRADFIKYTKLLKERFAMSNIWGVLMSMYKTKVSKA